MSLKQKLIALFTVIRKELQRIRRIWIIAFIGPIINLFLYFLIFGNIIGHRIGDIEQISYIKFIAPGIILSSVILISYGQISSSLFLMRFQRNIEEMLVTPMSLFVILLGLIISGIIRTFVVACMLFFIIKILFHVDIFINTNVIFDIITTSTLFASMGFTNALFAKDFDEVSLIPIFLILPLTYLGGIFYSISMLSDFWQKVALYNPIFYIVQNFRSDVLNLENVNAIQTNLMIVFLIVMFTIINLRLMKKGMELKK